jgi:hypothetical protein
MPAIERDGLSFHYLDERGTLRGGPSSSSTASGAASRNPQASNHRQIYRIMTPLQSLQKPI